jgi:hypothetical protein
MSPAERRARLARGDVCLKYGAGDDDSWSATPTTHEGESIATREEFEMATRYMRQQRGETGRDPSWDECVAHVRESRPARHQQAVQSDESFGFTEDDIGTALGTGPTRYKLTQVAPGATAQTRRLEQRAQDIRRLLLQRHLAPLQRRSLEAELNAMRFSGDTAHAPAISTPDWNVSSFNPPGPEAKPSLDQRLGIDFNKLPDVTPWIRPVVEDHKGQLGTISWEDHRLLKQYALQGNDPRQTLQSLGIQPQPLNRWFQDLGFAPRRGGPEPGGPEQGEPERLAEDEQPPPYVEPRQRPGFWYDTSAGSGRARR